MVQQLLQVTQHSLIAGAKGIQERSDRVAGGCLQFNTDGPPPDVVGAYVSKYWVGAVSTDGSFSFQGSDKQADTAPGVYVTHQCALVPFAAIAVWF